MPPFTRDIAGLYPRATFSVFLLISPCLKSLHPTHSCPGFFGLQHFTAMVWKGGRSFGCGVARADVPMAAMPGGFAGCKVGLRERVHKQRRLSAHPDR